MLQRRRLARIVTLTVIGGSLLQITGCVAGLAPVLLGFAESALYGMLLSGLVP